jgi:3-oxoadipate enol-lactonase
MPLVRVGDHALHYLFDNAGNGDKPVLVLSNSIGTDLSMWDGQIESLSARYRVLRYDTRGHGKSTVPTGPCSIAELGRDVLALLDHVGVAQAHVCGISLGGMTALWLGVNAPGRLRRVIAAANAASTASPEFWDERIATVRRDGMPALADGVMARFFSSGFHTARPEVVAAFRERFVATPAEGYAACCEAIRDLDLREGLATMNVPMLALAGALDVASAPENSRALARSVAGARYAELHAAHLLNVEAPEAFVRIVIEFLN